MKLVLDLDNKNDNTLPSHGGNTGSNPVGDASFFQ